MEELIVLLIYMNGSKTDSSHYLSISDYHLHTKLDYETHCSVLTPCVDKNVDSQFGFSHNTRW